MGNKGVMPRQRTEGLIVRTLGEETLILDRRSDVAHCLPADVSRVWAACTGTNTLARIAAAAGTDEPTVANAVNQLVQRDLIEVHAGADRREFLRRTALIGAGAVTVTGISSVIAPTAAWAQSPNTPIVASVVACDQSLTNGSGSNVNKTVIFDLSILVEVSGMYNVVVTPAGVPFVGTVGTSGGNATMNLINVGTLTFSASTVPPNQVTTGVLRIADPSKSLQLPSPMPVTVTVTPVGSTTPALMKVININYLGHTNCPTTPA